MLAGFIATAGLYTVVLEGSLAAFSATSESAANTFVAAASFGIGKVQSAQGASVGEASSVTAVFASQPGEYNLLVAVHHRTIGGVTVPSGWSIAVQEGNLTIAYKVAGPSESSSVTFSTTPTLASQTLTILEFSGTDPTVPLDRVASNSEGGIFGVTNLSTGTTGVTTVADEVLVAAIATDGDPGGFNNAWTNSFVRESDVISSGSVILSAQTTALRIVSATGQYETTESWNTARTAYGAIVTFKAAP